MILGIGIDLVDIERFVRFHQRFGARGLRRLFTAGEIDYCLGHAATPSSLAARFAAKEAFYKALGTGKADGGLWTDVEVVRLRNGAPALRLHGRAARNARERGARRLHLSLTHGATIAVAQVVLER